MPEKEQLVKVIDFWKATVTRERLFERELASGLDAATKEVVDLVGVRRCGKSSIFKLLIRRLGLEDKALFVNFEDPYFIVHNSPAVIEELIETYREYYYSGLEYLFFDEIQAISGWEKAVRKLRDSGEYRIFVTGSSSKLLSGEFSTLLTGRHLSHAAFPLSFREFLAFKGVQATGKRDLALKSTALLKAFSEYLENGGFPEVVVTGNKTLLQQYFKDIVYKDIAGRHEVRQTDVLEKLGVFLVTNSARTLSAGSVSKAFGISHEFASLYLEYFKEAFLVFDLPQFSYSLKTQAKALKKYYSVDTGLANAVSFRFSEDKGRMLEQSVFLHLARTGADAYYYKTRANQEIDFLVKTRQNHRQLIQVSWSLQDTDTRKRELAALFRAMDELRAKTALVLTYDEQETISQAGKTITVAPAWKWMLETTTASP
ncbi:MAG: ATP-binding protein [Candidatus Micrarchaeota archaeon]